LKVKYCVWDVIFRVTTIGGRGERGMKGMKGRKGIVQLQIFLKNPAVAIKQKFEMAFID